MGIKGEVVLTFVSVSFQLPFEMDVRIFWTAILNFALVASCVARPSNNNKTITIETANDEHAMDGDLDTPANKIETAMKRLPNLYQAAKEKKRAAPALPAKIVAQFSLIGG